MNMRSIVLLVLLTTISSKWAFGDQLQFTNIVKASIEFREESKESAHYPHLLLIYLHLENLHDSGVTWVCNPVSDINAELLDSKSNPVAQAPAAASIISSDGSYMIPYHSQLDWMISHQGISMMGDLKNSYVLMVGGKGWLIPRNSIASYSLKLTIRGLPWTQHITTAVKRDRAVLFDLPLTTIKIKE